MVKKYKPKSTWRIYADGIKSIGLIFPAIFSFLTGFVWLIIGMLLCAFQLFSPPDVGHPLLIFPFPLNVIIGGLAIFVIIPLAIIHIYKWMDDDY